MRYRRLDSDGDYTFGNGRQNYLVDSPDAVAQAAKTRLLLFTREWFLDLGAGTPYAEQIQGFRSQPVYDFAIRKRIIGTPGVREIAEYQSTLDAQARRLTVTATLITVFGQTTLETTL